MINADQLFMAIHNCDDQYVEEVLEKMSAVRHKARGISSIARAAAAVIACILLIGTGVTALAAVSESFRDWLMETFTDYEKNILLPLSDELKIVQGERESFICESVQMDDETQVTKVYRIAGDKLEPLKIEQFQGDYDGALFSFEYATIAGEIYGFNQSGCITRVFPVMNETNAYVALSVTDEVSNMIERACVASVDLKTGSVNKISNDNMKCNFAVVPGGRRLLCNHRADEYWSIFDLDTGDERVLEGINGYARVREISFIDENHIFAPADTGSIESATNLIDLRTGEVTRTWEGEVGELTPEWCWRELDDSIEIYNLVTEDSFTVDKSVSEKAFYDVSAIGNYVLLWEYDHGKTYVTYIWNTVSQKGMNIDIPEELRGSVEIYLAASEQKLIVSSGSDAYLVDIGRLGKTF